MGYKISQLTALNQAPSGSDIIPIVDVSDFTQASSGSTKKVTVGELANAIGTGDTGVKGDTGSQGIQGIKGDTGVKGDTGSQGIQGIQGDTGTFLAKGDTGSQGDTGVGGISFIYNETPSGTIDGTNAAFDTAFNYVSGTIQVYRDGQLMKGGGDDYTETDANTITFTTAPVSNSVLLVSYQKVTSTNGNADTVDGFNANSTPTANNIPVLDSNAKMPISTVNPIHPLNAPEGFLINGKITPSVASNNLTVAIKTLAGNDPSATDPVYIRLGDTIRTITSALSVTLNAGTNWFNSGSSELATKEVDYFVYLGYETDETAVRVGFGRIPFANRQNDYSSTNTNDKHIAFDDALDSGNSVSLIGRFAATLSAGAGYTWTIPTFNATNLIQRPVYETRWLNCVVAPYGDAGSLGTFAQDTLYQKYKLRYDNSFVRLTGRVTNKGSWSGSVVINMPISAKETMQDVYFQSGWVANNTNPITASRGGIKLQSTTTLTVVSNIYNAQLQWSTAAANDSYWVNGEYSI